MSSDLRELWTAAFEGEIADRAESSKTAPQQWKIGGKTSKANPNAEDETWWRENGLKFTESYVEWRKSTAWQIWITPEGEPAIELELKCNFGDVPVRMFIDRVFEMPNGELAVVDLKSGAQPPKDQGMQLGFYASGLEVVFGRRPTQCAYYSARKGGLSEPYRVAHWTPTFLGRVLGEFVRAREAGLYLPNPSQNCNNCGVRRACAAVNGPEAHTFDPLYVEGK